MFKRLGHVLLIIALLMATGSHWAVLQSVAWTTMLADNLRSHSFSEAIDRTFDGKHPCRLCCQINEGKKTEKKSEFPPQIKKLEFPSPNQPLAVFATSLRELVMAPEAAVHSVLHRPPVPPPRELLA